MNQLEKNYYNNQTFEDIKHVDEKGIEYWYARELQIVLDYKEWRKFENVINKAKDACENSGISAFEHFVDVDKLSKRANNAEVVIKDYQLTRYACYLIAQNGDSRKKVIALAQTYFAIQISQTEQKLKRDKIQTEKEANIAHYNVGKNIREVIAKNGGTMPEDLPTPKKSLKQLEKENMKSLQKIG